CPISVLLSPWAMSTSTSRSRGVSVSRRRAAASSSRFGGGSTAASDVEPPVSAGQESVPAGESCPPPAPPVGPPAPRRGSSSLSSRRLVVVGAMTAPPSTTVRIESSSRSGRVALRRHPQAPTRRACRGPSSTPVVWSAGAEAGGQFVVEQASGRRGGDDGSPVDDGADRVEQHLGQGVLEEEPGGAAPQGVQGVLIIVEGGQDDDLRGADL